MSTKKQLRNKIRRAVVFLQETKLDTDASDQLFQRGNTWYLIFLSLFRYLYHGRKWEQLSLFTFGPNASFQQWPSNQTVKRGIQPHTHLYKFSSPCSHFSPLFCILLSHFLPVHSLILNVLISNPFIPPLAISNPFLFQSQPLWSGRLRDGFEGGVDWSLWLLTALICKL